MLYIRIFIYILFATIVLLFITNKHRAQTPDIVGCTMEARICPDGSAVGRTGPNCEFAPCDEIETETLDPMIRVDTPHTGAVITSPVTITGRAHGNWFFEAGFPVSIVNWDGLIVGEGIATAQGDWMTTEFVPFTAVITYTIVSSTPYARGTLILKKDNPSGLSEHDDAREIPILFGELNETTP